MRQILPHAGKKLRGTRGDGLPEALIAVMIVALSTAMLSTMISASAQLITKSNDALLEYYALENVLNAQEMPEEAPEQSRYRLRAVEGTATLSDGGEQSLVWDVNLFQIWRAEDVGQEDKPPLVTSYVYRASEDTAPPEVTP